MPSEESVTPCVTPCSREGSREGSIRHPVVKDSIGEPHSRGDDNRGVIVCEQICVLTRPLGGVISNRRSSVWPLVFPAPLVSSWAFAGAVAAADGMLMVQAALL